MNTNDLIVDLNQAFSCIDGPARAQFEIPLDDLPGEGTFLRIVYRTIRVAMRGSAEQVEEVLCRWASLRLRELITEEQIQDHGVVLFWRSKPTLLEFSDETGRICTQLRLRLAIPGVSLAALASPEGEAPRWL